MGEKERKIPEYEIYVFDLDGTLLDTLDDLTAAVNAAMREVGTKERTREEVRAYVGNGIKLLVLRALTGGNEDLFVENGVFERAFACFKAYYGAHLAEKTAPYPDVTALLQRLKAAKKRVAVVSNKADFAVKKLCERYFGALVEAAVGEREEDGIRKKPAPDSTIAAIDALGGGNAVYIGDSEVDIATAKNANLSCVSVCWGFKDEAFLRRHGASVCVYSPNEIF